MVVGVCGYGYTGSSAYLDLLKEYEEFDFNETKKVMEFTLPYQCGGLSDLEFHLTKAPVKHLAGDDAIDRFKRVINSNRRSFDRLTDNAFSTLSKEYINSLVQVEYNCHKYKFDSDYWFLNFKEKALSTVQKKLERKFHRYIPLLKENKRYISVYPEHFVEKTKRYISEILLAAGLNEEKKGILLDQPFPPNNPGMVFHYFNDPYAIVVNRDPRDVYVQAKHLSFSFSRFVPHDDVKDFVTYYRSVIQHYEKDDPRRVLRLNFEDLVYKYDETVNRIEDFLHISKHASPGKYFDPGLSIRHTQMMDVFPEDQEDIAYIEKELQEYLYPFEKFQKVTSRDGIYTSLSANKYKRSHKQL